MKLPPDDLQDQWIAQYGEDALSDIPVPEIGPDFEITIRRLSYVEFRDFANPSIGDGSDNAATLAMHRASLWPSRPEINEACKILVGLRSRIMTRVQWLSGNREELWRRLDQVSDEELVEIGMPENVVAELRARYPHPGQVVICEIPEISVVIAIRRPTKECGKRMVERQAKEFFDATSDASIESAVWPEPDRVAAIFREWPAIPPCVLFPKLASLMQGEASGAAKKFARKGRPSAT